MNSTTLRRPASFRLNSKLLDMLKERAKASNRSLNNYVESVLLNAVFSDELEPNETTIAAIEEANSDKKLEKLNLDNFKDFVASL